MRRVVALVLLVVLACIVGVKCKGFTLTGTLDERFPIQFVTSDPTLRARLAELAGKKVELSIVEVK